MFKTKSEVDKHVGKIFMRSKSESDKHREYFKIAKLYFGVKEYEHAKMYLSSYLSETTNDSVAWKLMGEITDIGDKNMHKSIDCYSKSYELDPADSKVLLKICSCYINIKEKFDTTLASKWLERAELVYPYEKQVVLLKERLFNLYETSLSNKEWENFLLKGLSENYYNEELHIKLIKNYLGPEAEDNDIFKGLQQISKVESNSIFDSKLSWYSSILEIFETCKYCLPKQQSSFSEMKDMFDLVNLTYLQVLCHYIVLSLQSDFIDDDKKVSKLNYDLFVKFDTSLFIYDEYIQKKKTFAK